MTRNNLLLATALVGAVLSGSVFAQGNAPTSVPTPGTPAPQVTVAPANTVTTGVTPTGVATTVPPTVTIPRMAVTDPMKIDHMGLRTGMRTSKVVGMTVVNSNNEALGTIDDLIVMPNETVPYAVLSVGGFLGMGAHYVVVPYGMLAPRDNKQMLLPNATKDSLKALPSFVYPT